MAKRNWSVGANDYIVQPADLERLDEAKKNVQEPVQDPAADGEAVEFISSLSQNEQGVVSAEKRTIPAAAASDSGEGGTAGLMSASDKEKLDGVEAGAQKNVKPDWNAVAGSSAEILNKPVIPAPQVQSNWGQANDEAPDFIKNKPEIPPAQIPSDWNQQNQAAVDFIKNKPSIPEPQIPSDWNQQNSSARDFIKNKPAIPAAQVQSDWDQANDEAVDFIKNKPTIPTVPAISTNISQDGSSDSMTASPKAVKTFVEGKGYVDQQGIAGKADRTELAPQFDPSARYSNGDMVTYGNVTYKCVSENGHSGAWDASDFEASTMYDYVGNIEDALEDINGGAAGQIDLTNKLFSEAAAPDFSSSSTYAVGDYVTYRGFLYECVVAKTSPNSTPPNNDINSSTYPNNHWRQTDMTTPDATLDTTPSGSLRLVMADGTVVWQEGYALKAESSVALSDSAMNYYEVASGDATVSLSLPAHPNGKVGDLLLCVSNGQSSDVVFSIDGLDSTLSVVVPKGTNLVDLMTVAAGEMCILSFTLSAFKVAGLPTWLVGRQTVENGGGTT